MAEGQQHALSRYVRLTFNVGTIGDLTDTQLLERFTAREGETAELAFTALVERHGPMVFRVCSSVLRDPDAAHDAFQATFLVLVQRARSLWVRDSLGPWLHQVAYRVSWRARSAEACRRRREQAAAGLASFVGRDETRDDLADAVHDEVNRLPRNYRAAVILCYFEGLSPEQAAGRLDCPVGTVQSRLARGRRRLHARLTQRGLAPAIGALAAGIASKAAPAALVKETIQAVLPLQGGVATASVIRLTQGVLRSMFLIKFRMVAANLIVLTALAAGAPFFLFKGEDPRPEVNLEQIRAELGAQDGRSSGQAKAPVETGPPPGDLKWTDVAPADRLRIIERLAAQSRGNYEKIKTWRGVYDYVLRENLEEKFVAQVLAGAFALASKSAPQGRTGPLLQEFESVLTFAIDIHKDSIYRDIETKRMRFLKTGTDEEIKVPNVGPPDHRSIVTPESYFYFHPKDRATTAFLPDHPDAQWKRRVERFPVHEAQMREGGAPDPRAFFKFDPGNSFWTGMELYAKALRGELGADQKQTTEDGLRIAQSDGPGGRWYQDQMGFTNPAGPMLWVTTLWSPLAGYNPVRMVVAHDKPDGKLESKIEWQWKAVDDIYIPSSIKELAYRSADGGLSKQQETRLKEYVLNRPLGLHQFDERGLGLNDGDLVLNHLERVAYIIKGGEPVRLAKFGERSVLHATTRTRATETHTPRRSVGRIYTTASLRLNDAGMPVFSSVAVDPESGEVTQVMDDAPGRLRIAPDGRSLAYVWGDSSASSPAERMRQSLWTLALGGGARPKRVAQLEGQAGGALPVWSPDSKQIILSVGARDESRQQWAFETFRINADGTGREPIKIPPEDSVQDWSPDGAWIVTTSSRNARIGWQLYLMRPDGSEARQVTEGGNPFYARFSPDGRRLLYSDGTLRLPERQGVWIADLNGKNRRRLLPTGNGTASACWSPDGQQIVVAIGGVETEDHGRLEIVNLDGNHRTILTMPGRDITDMPDWR
jgi:RNA polymerase sigma factor (sigma-70 family)